jgi:hypothetical protein
MAILEGGTERSSDERRLIGSSNSGHCCDGACFGAREL